MGELRLVIAGVAGRMGRALVAVAQATPGVRVAAALARKDSGLLGQDAGVLAGCGEIGVKIMSDPLAAVVAADAILDFTAPAFTMTLATLAAQARIVHVIGTTGFSPQELQRLDAAARHAIVIRSGNMSLGVNLMAALVERAAHALGPEFDIEIVEMHHRQKVDAPSGTALLLGEAAAQGRKIDLAECSVRARDGHTGARPKGAIGFASLRGGTVVGDHRAIFAGAGERLEIVHIAEDRSIFARGAVQAALWGRSRKAGLYSMRHVLGLGD